MLSHTTLSVPQSSGQTSRCASRKIGEGVYSIVGRVLLPSEVINAYHIGIKVTADEVDLVWENEVEDGNSVLKLGNVWYGRFDADRDTLSMIKHWHFAGSPWKSKLELCIFSSGTSRNPTRKRTEWPSAFKLPP
ncbi:phosphatidylcholine-hydrolyzing phospholipase c [Fusarium napiforme]|uniref:Phosphatidylcholine-hydrolyzing phospholipase c n=1 Tax=Fusarium napiforme TaxID=42672 RepID=A0A8H5JJU8_9HYPO|nr:phosphatidylcholine-hydrolyzing phospholipase c [Fusarium napiforme]